MKKSDLKEHPDSQNRRLIPDLKSTLRQVETNDLFDSLEVNMTKQAIIDQVKLLVVEIKKIISSLR